MVTVEQGKTVRVYVPEDKKEQVQKRIDNFRSLREKIEKISTLNRELLKGGRLFEQD
jgi:tetrahydromethanopterin S-methyltransferase subunit G